MRLFLNILFAWLATVAMLLLTVIWVIRILQKKDVSIKNNKFISNINRYLRKTHISMGVFFIFTSYIHARFSSFSIFSWNFGTIAFVVGILICLTYSHRKNIGKLWMKRHRELTVLILLFTVVHIIEVDGFVGFDKVRNAIAFDIENASVKNHSSGKLKDGEYTGEGYGYSPGLKVSVKIESGKIADVSILEHNEVGEMFYGPAFDIVTNEIVKNQSTDIDSVSGATLSSNGIREAVNDALSKAR